MAGRSASATARSKALAAPTQIVGRVGELPPQGPDFSQSGVPLERLREDDLSAVAVTLFGEQPRLEAEQPRVAGRDGQARVDRATGSVAVTDVGEHRREVDVGIDAIGVELDRVPEVVHRFVSSPSSNRASPRL